MLRAIPLPDESVWGLKQRHDPMMEFTFRMRLWELDIALRVEGLDKDINLAQIDYLVCNGDWPEC